MDAEKEKGGKKLQCRLGFIGCGNMAQAIIKGLVYSQTIAPPAITVMNKSNSDVMEQMQVQGFNTVTSIAELLQTVDVVVLAVKPQVVSSVCMAIAQTGEPKFQMIISIAAGVTISAIQTFIGNQNGFKNFPIARVMPNTPCLVGEMAAGFAVANCAKEQSEVVATMFGSVGICFELPESKLDAVTGLSGSGPAYMFIAIEAMADGGVKAGLPRDVALKLAAQTMMGAAKMVLETEQHPAVLKDKVCSPGGTTIEAVSVLERSGFRSALIDAVFAATAKSKGMA